MAIIECKCPSCGAPLKVNNDDDAAICEYCGKPFVVEKVINVGRDYIKNQTINEVKQDNEYSARISAHKSSLYGIVCMIIMAIIVLIYYKLAT